MCATEKSVFCNSINPGGFAIKTVMIRNDYLMLTWVWANFFLCPLFFRTPFDLNGRYENFAPLYSGLLASEHRYGLVASRGVF